MRSLVSFPLLVALLTLTGCSSLSGLQDAQSDFACSVDMTPRCASLSAVHESLDKEETLGKAIVIREESDRDTVSQSFDPLTVQTPLMSPKRAPEEILRIWIAPYIDTEGDLHAEHVIFTTVRTARWAPESLEIKSLDDSSDRIISPLKGSAR